MRVRATLFLLLVALALLPVPLAAEVLSAAAYRERLAGIDTRLRAGDWVGARTAAKDLLDDRVAFGDEALETDRSILRPLADARDATAARAAAPRLTRLVEALAALPATEAARSDRAILDEVRAREALAELPQGGSLPKKRTTILETLAEILAPAAEWLKDVWERLWDWLLDLLPDGEEKGSVFGLDLPGLVTVFVVLLAVLGLWLAWKTFRNRRRRAELAAVAAEAPPPAEDADPLSRASSEWERYAAELAAAGRHREAIRAWYHAVLVTLFRGGALHYRKGRTNWEYVTALAPGHAWRAHFIELTRHFEREWYGRDESTPEALGEAEDMARGLLGALREAA
ncbi:MAG TPA: DUF4129 domain-containing protein [Thermoanaerobaculia bacterium]|nr:DUF4129 domain-containing protein [Thermoanaerobaculia bacterium]